ncbi:MULTISPECIES: hypothetical protein [unclassified Paracoccus (in: a-proteobacteria)]|uniref:hypothetical protein n=1 Tax=unclassified Paracoccus (in: a-proteobacteria) TaxID=2688777 RepID=UPI0021E12C2F|nr:MULTISPECIES: hypothetical protein [unclassified Paracoccus (in: a-proteobacteria)]UXU76530.1 hypothetical protein GB879_014230 [Paracoccus sp. SMMA_5]UXU82403.1 hypothetical protein GB880_014205 [Paracoccus sp. SMMA_5_TC]
MFGMRRIAAVFLIATTGPLPVHAQGVSAPPDFQATCAQAGQGLERRVVCADLVALDQTLVYNRFGSFNPFGMIFALRRDVVAMGNGAPELPDCTGDTGTQAPPADLRAGAVRLRDCRRPRPVVLRGNVGDLMLIRLTNLLAPPPERPRAGQPDDLLARELSRDFCDKGTSPLRPLVSDGSQTMRDHGEALCEDPQQTALEAKQAGAQQPAKTTEPDAGLIHADWPRTRGVNLAIQGLMPVPMPGQGQPDPACLALDAVAPGRSVDCLYELVHEGTNFLASRAAPAGGEGDGGSITHGLFGAVLVERPGTRWYRSQVTAAALNLAWPGKDQPRHARQGVIDYDVAVDGVPVLNMARVVTGGDYRGARALELVHADLNAIIWCDADSDAAKAAQPKGCAQQDADYGVTHEQPYQAFREFSVFFHDELKTFYTRNFDELARFGQLAGVRDGFAINYGASGMGTMLLANRKGIGPAASCMECLYEEFFLSSWANGDPALLEWYPDDPSNVHHSYLNDPVVFRNFHAGPKETHVFHLHAHQWFAGNDPARGSYLDSQTVAPAQGFTYNIYHGGRGGGQGGWAVGGAGNRNRTVGDSIFHCHLYPHFAQGMWALWRVHDVFEDGTRKLPDGQAQPGLSATIRTPEEARFRRLGSVDSRSGAWMGEDDPATPDIEGAGTPVPALIPLPGEALPPLPTYGDAAPAPADQALQPTAPTDRGAALLPRRGGPARPLVAVGAGPERLIRTQASGAEATVTSALRDERPVPDAMPGYPFYIAGMAGRRPPQAPYDIARKLDSTEAPTDELLSGGLGRHIVLEGTRSLPFDLPQEIEAEQQRLEAALDQPDEARRLERLRGQIVAKALALGDMTLHLDSARILTLNPEGEPLERAAQAFHHDGRGLTVLAPDGTPLPARVENGVSYAATNGGYKLPRAPVPGSTATQPGEYQVNGAPPAPGAPFADPCGGAANRDGDLRGTDPLTRRADYVVDPALLGFRRYEVSAVQLDLVVNRAGWHDPQARIDVLTRPWAEQAGSDQFKLDDDDGSRISPTTRDDAEPFFFRARSGECIEFRHTNELPKELQLDDFQVRTPTDTIGQHIHLVKFDVTSSDGSGNGWNYEDGTFAPDELMARRCAAVGGGLLTPQQVDAGLLGPWGTRTPAAADCPRDAQGHLKLDGQIWRKKLSSHRDLFQTTVQRWFADPILTRIDPQTVPDRTLRTVFSHDHFGPSSIQQHGFYTALLIEPPTRLLADGRIDTTAEVCDPHRPDACSEPLTTFDRFALHQGTPDWVGSHKIVRYASNDPFHPDYREFALAVADFAVLYDPRDREEASAIEPRPGAHLTGMARLYCEARLAQQANPATAIADQCGGVLGPEPDVAPAYWAAGLPGDIEPHRRWMSGTTLIDEATALRQHLLDYRRRAASPHGAPVSGPDLAKAVAPPERPESISVDHHDPYLVNYRNAPLPLRLAGNRRDGSVSPDCLPMAITQAGLRMDPQNPSEVVRNLTQGRMPRCSYSYQLAGARGDAGNVLSSWWPDQTAGMPEREPETPLFEAYQDERLLFRLVQGAQEVQHVFNIAGLAAPRNIDQRFSQGMRDLAVSAPPARQACFTRLRLTRPQDYEEWLNHSPSRRSGPASLAYTDEQRDWFARLERALARCDNVEGYTFAQEIGISEHFEMRGRLRSDLSTFEFDSANPAGMMTQPAQQPVPGQGLTQASDYLYNFGTLDALWNGAWGLVRVYADPQARAQLLRDAWPDHPAPKALVPVRPQAETEESDTQPQGPATGPAVEALAAGAVCPMPTRELLDADAQGDGARQLGTNVAALVVALRTADVWPEQAGTDYGAHRKDPDGLMLALLNPVALSRDISVKQDWQRLTRSEVIAAVRRLYSRPEPFVLRVNAGDCITLRYVNLLRTDAQGSLPDALGDALLPPIAPLNVDPAPHVEGRDANGLRATLQPTVADGPATGLRPSGRLGLSIGLPGGDLLRELPLGYGINRWSMPAAGGDLAEVSPPYQFYAGRLRIDMPTDQDFDDVAQETVNAMAFSLTNWGIAAAGATRENTGQAAHFSLLGRDYWVEKTAVLQPDQIQLMQDMAQSRLQRRFHFIPYAFGAVPVRVTGDIVSQPAHGLFGIIDVVPQGWAIPAALQPAITPPRSATLQLQRLAGLGLIDADDTRLPAWRSAPLSLAQAGPGWLQFGAPVTYHGVVLDPERPANAPRVRIREFVIFYQDGLNHHDSRSKIVWRMNDRAMPELRLTPDCPVCDDSYDRGEQGVSYRSRPFASLLRFADIGRDGRIEASDDLNALRFPDRFFAGQGSGGGPTEAARQPLTLGACPGDQVLIRAVHPGGRARQRAFALNGLGYDDLFPGFGFPNAALLAPGKAVSAWVHPPARLLRAGPGQAAQRQPFTGKVLWHDGPNFLMAGGTWGLLEFDPRHCEGPAK